VRQKQVMKGLARIGALDGVTVAYPHTALCDLETCQVADGLRALYFDDDHLSPFGAARVSALVRGVIDGAGWEAAPPSPSQRSAHPE
jgi:SGNH domain-containing protein